MKVINNRPLFFVFIAFGLGIFFARPIFSLSVQMCIFAFLVIGACFCLCIKYKHIKRLALIICSFLIGVICFFVSSNNFIKQDYGMQNYEISGRVAISTNYSNSQNLIIDNIYLNGNKIKHNIQVYVYESVSINEGNIITFSSTIQKAVDFV